jgi:hypothetical protein
LQSKVLFIYTMKEENSHLENLKEIRAIMERSSQFISLSGLSGVFAGIFALLGALAVFLYKYDFFYGRYYRGGVFLREDLIAGNELQHFIVFLIGVGVLVLILAMASGVFFTTRNARIKGLPYWNSSAKRMLTNLFIPLFAGGLFCIALFYHKLVYLIAPATLIFYGLALINAAKYTLRDIHYLGLAEIALGILASFMIGYGLVFWSIGFGILHIFYGLTMYFKYERVVKQSQ